MPVFESNASRSLRDRWPLEFDLEGVPNENREREYLLNQKREVDMPNPVTNSFAVDYQVGNNVIDINHPPRKPYVFQEFPKMLHKPNGAFVVVNDAHEEKKKLKEGYSVELPPRNQE
jgi:hypothetical protein